MFNASVVLSGVRSPTGGSGTLLAAVTQGKIQGIISESILDEIMRNSFKVGLSQQEISRKCRSMLNIVAAPEEHEVHHFRDVVSDLDDAHLFATYKEMQGDYLVSLDKRHVLSLQDKIKGITIGSPKQLIEALKGNRSKHT